LIRRPTSPACVDAARRALLDACYGVSPRIEDVAPGLVQVDVAGLGRLVGDEGAIVERLSRAGRAVGLPARVGVAGTRTAARVVERLTVRLSAAYLVADALELRLALAGGSHEARTVALACPMDAPRPLLTLLEHDLAARPPHAPVTAVAVQARAIPRRAVGG